MNTILLFGAGKSATVLIDYLVSQSPINNYELIIADVNKDIILEKTANSPYAQAIAIDITNDEQRQQLIAKATVVISLMPPSLHFLIAQDCVKYSKNLLTASYVDDNIKLLQKDIQAKGLLFICEMGLDPGIDHMSAMQLLDHIKEKGGVVTSFKSHCGGLVALESNDNPWQYKISWNPRNIVLAGNAGALYKLDNKLIKENYEDLFDASRRVEVPTIGGLAFYPNRDSVSYISTYQLQEATTFIRTTLRYPNFIIGWKKIIELKLTDENVMYETDGKSLASFFEEHLTKNNLEFNFDKQSDIIKQQFDFLGFNDNTTFINKGKCSATDILQFALEKKLVLQPPDKDMIVMLHEIEYYFNQQKHKINSYLIVKGDDNKRTAMAKTVGLPLGIAAVLILNGTIKTTGLHIPVTKEIYEPVLKELKKLDICFQETNSIVT